MAAGLGFKDFTTGEVLTAADVDGYLMQGVWVFASAAARDAAVTSPQEGNFAYLKDTNVTTYYTGSAWANLDTTGMTNPMTTTGDTIYSSSGSTPARLGIGSTGNVLTVAGGVPTWAAPAGGGGMTLLSTTTLSSSLTNITSISQSYNNLQIELSDVYATSGNGPVQVRLNGSNGLHFGLAEFNVGAATITQYSTDAVIYLWNNSGTQYYSSTRKVNASVDVYNYTSTNLNKAYAYCGSYTDTSSTTRSGGYGGGAFWDSTAITSVSIYNDNTLNGTVKIWGIK
jgi:hypothetical protein